MTHLRHSQAAQRRDLLPFDDGPAFVCVYHSAVAACPTSLDGTRRARCRLHIRSYDCDRLRARSLATRRAIYGNETLDIANVFDTICATHGITDCHLLGQSRLSHRVMISGDVLWSAKRGHVPQV